MELFIAVFGEAFGLNGDNVLEQHYSLFDLVVVLVSNCELFLHLDLLRVVFGEMALRPLESFFQTLDGLLSPSIHP